MTNLIQIKSGINKKIDKIITDLALCKMSGNKKKRIDYLIDQLKSKPFNLTKMQIWVKLQVKLSDLKKEPMK